MFQLSKNPTMDQHATDGFYVPTSVFNAGKKEVFTTDASRIDYDTLSNVRFSMFDNRHLEDCNKPFVLEVRMSGIHDEDDKLFHPVLARKQYFNFKPLTEGLQALNKNVQGFLTTTENKAEHKAWVEAREAQIKRFVDQRRYEDGTYDCGNKRMVRPMYYTAFMKDSMSVAWTCAALIMDRDQKHPTHLYLAIGEVVLLMPLGGFDEYKDKRSQKDVKILSGEFNTQSMKAAIDKIKLAIKLSSPDHSVTVTEVDQDQTQEIDKPKTHVMKYERVVKTDENGKQVFRNNKPAYEGQTKLRYSTSYKEQNRFVPASNDLPARFQNADISLDDLVAEVDTDSQENDELLEML